MVSADEAITRAVGIKRARSYDAREGQSQRPTEKNATNRNADETSNTSEPEESNEYEELRFRIISDNKALFTARPRGVPPMDSQMSCPPKCTQLTDTNDN